MVVEEAVVVEEVVVEEADSKSAPVVGGAVDVDEKSSVVVEEAVVVNMKSSVVVEELVVEDENGSVVAVDASRIKEEETRSVVALYAQRDDCTVPICDVPRTRKRVHHGRTSNKSGFANPEGIVAKQDGTVLSQLASYGRALVHALIIGTDDIVLQREIQICQHVARLC